MLGRLSVAEVRSCRLIVLFTILFSVHSELVKPTFQPIFKQDEAVRNYKSKEILRYMNLSVDPCQDFYGYACGNWENYHKNLEAHEIFSTSQYLELKIEADLVRVLEETAKGEDGFNGLKVKEFYRSCKNALPNGQKQQEFFSEFIKENGGFPAVPGYNWDVQRATYDWQKIIGDLRYQYSMNILIGVDIVLNPLNTYEYTVYLGEPSTILPYQICSAEGTQKIAEYRAEYETIEREVTSNLKEWISIKSPDAEKIASDILLFEFELCTAMKVPEHQNNQSYNYLRRTLNELTRHFNDSIDFNRFLSSSLGMPYAKPVTIISEKYFQHLIHTLSIHDKSVVANYIMYRALSILSFPRQDNKENRPTFCMEVIKRYFAKVLGSMYYRRYANLHVKEEIIAIFDQLKESFKYSLRSPWLEEGTSRVGSGKLEDIVLYFPTYEEKPNLKDIHIDENNYWKNIKQIMFQPQREQIMFLISTETVKPTQDVEAYELTMKYRNEFKRIDIGWALLQSPFYEQLYPHSMHYAMIGQKLGRELATAFDDLGWSADILNLSNWDHITALEYETRSECFRRQISFYLNNTVDAFQNVTQLREIIAISGGVNVAFVAYLYWLNFMNPKVDEVFQQLKKETLPDVNFTNTQLFFVTYAQMNCHHWERNRTADACCPLQGHSLERYKVNGPLGNNFEFGKEFQCKIGSQMNPADKCVIY